MTYDDVVNYSKQIDIALTRGDVLDIIEYANEWEIADTKTAVWEFLDAYEGISHTRDLEFFHNGDDYDQV